MNHPLAAIHPVTRLRAADLPPPPTPAPSPAEAFAPQLARACERGFPQSSSAPARSGLSPISDLAEAPSFRPWETRAAEANTSAEPSGGSASDSDDENQPRSTGEEAAESSRSPETPAGVVLVALTPLALRLAGGTLVTAEGAAAESPATAPETQSDSAGQETAMPVTSRAGATAKLAAKPGEVTVAATTPAPPTAAVPKPDVPKPDLPKALPVPVAETAVAPAPAGGTSVAPLTPPMNVAQNMNKTSGQEEPKEQNLPPTTATAQLLAEKAGVRGFSSSHASPTADAASAVTVFVHPATESVPTPAPMTPIAPVDPTAKIVALMASAVVRLRQTGADDFEVAIQPDPNTEILLRVTLQGNGAEIHAELRRGDAAAFAARWQELQERLAQQGVKLAALSAGDDRAGSFGQNAEFASPQQQSEPEGEAAPFGYAATTTTANTGRPVPVQPGTVRGWETWA